MRGGECSRRTHSCPTMIGWVGNPSGQTSGFSPRALRTAAMSVATAAMVSTTVSIGPVVKFEGTTKGEVGIRLPSALEPQARQLAP